MSATITTEGQVTCRRCHRALTSSSSRVLGVGPRCAAIEAATAGLKPAQTEKVLEAVADRAAVRIRKGVYRISSSAGETSYLTSVKGICNCPHGLKTKTVASCWHVAFARLTDKPRRTVKRGQFTKAA